MDDSHDPPLIPARMLNEFAYCPRLCYIEWIQREFFDSVDTVDGRFQHRRMDLVSGGHLSDQASSNGVERIHARSVSLSRRKNRYIMSNGPFRGFWARSVTPVDYKRGSAPDIPEGAYEPERVQLCAQGLVLRENGFVCDKGVVYFVSSKTRVDIPFDDALVSRTQQLIEELRLVAALGTMPPPLQDSPKCPHCSLVGICLPDEVNLIHRLEADDMAAKNDELDKSDATGATDAAKDKVARVRKLVPALDDTKPVYVAGQGQTIRKRGDMLEIWSREGKETEARLREISQVNIYGGVEITTPAMVELMGRDIPVLHFTHGGWFLGAAMGHSHKNVELRLNQYRWATNSDRSLLLARQIVNGKIRNCRTMLRRNDPERSKVSLGRLYDLANQSLKADSLSQLLGIEGQAAEIYFSSFGSMLKSDVDHFIFENRNRRPPKDPVNAVLSYLYAVLVKELFVALQAVGFDPYLGFYHQPRYGKPALALDMMEEFRPLIADSVTLHLFNHGELSKNDFVNAGMGVSLTPDGKKVVLGGYERRMRSKVTHPMFGYSVTYRRLLEVQSRLLARTIYGEIQEYPPFCTR